MESFNFVEELDLVLSEFRKMLIEKNKKYGNSALEPIRIFSNSDPIEQINVRIDDKLSRILRGDKLREDEDVEQDLSGYLILKRIYNNVAKRESDKLLFGEYCHSHQLELDINS